MTPIIKKAGKYLLVTDHKGEKYKKICSSEEYKTLKEKFQLYLKGVEAGNTEKTLNRKFKLFKDFFTLETKKKEAVKETVKKAEKKINKKTKSIKNTKASATADVISQLEIRVASGEELSSEEKNRIRKLLNEKSNSSKTSSRKTRGEY